MTTKPNPYVGPRSFRMGEALYGRDREVQELIDLLIAERIVLLHSPSGAGKSSLLQAALAPAMRQEGFAVRPAMRVGTERPGGIVGVNRYVFSCMQSLEEAPSFSGQTFDEYLGAGSQSELLIFDQFEEILTVDPMDRPGKEAFFMQLGAVLRRRTRWALFAMREDYVAALDQYSRPVPTRFSNRYGLKLLELDAALLAMREPAARAGVNFGPAAASKLADDLRRVQVQLPDGGMEEQLGLYIEPVQLQVVCYRLWEHLAGGAMSIEEADIGGAGDVNSALEGYYAESVAAIAAESGVAERVIRDWCEHSLITAQGIRGQVLQGRDVTEGLANQAIGMLEDRHLVRTEKRRGATWYELAHDRLIAPVKQSNAKWREANLSPMQKRASLWEEQHRPDSLLMLDAELAEAQRWAAGQGGLTYIERAFLAESETAQKGVELGKRQSRRIRQLAAVACVVALCAVGLGIWAYLNFQKERDLEQETTALLNETRQEKQAKTSAQQEAKTQRQEAETQRQEAQTQRKEAETQRQQALNALAATQQAKRETQQQTTLATAQRLASAAFALRTTQLNAARLLSAAAFHMKDAPETRSALLATAAFQSNLIDSITNSSPITTAAMSPDGKRVAIAGTDGGFRFFDFQQGGFKNTGTDARVGVAIASMAFSADSQSMATAYPNAPAVVLWHWSGNGLTRDPQQLTVSGAHITSLALSPLAAGNGDWLAVGTDHGVQLWNWRTRVAMPGVPDDGAAVSKVAFSADGKWLAACYSTGPVMVFDLATHSLVRKPYNPIGRGAFRSMSFSPKTNLLAWVTQRGAEQVGDPRNPAAAPGTDNMSSAAFLADGSLASAGTSEVVLRDGNQNRRILSPPIVQAQTVVLPDPADGGKLLTVSGNTVYLWDARSFPIIGWGIAFAGRDNRTAATIRLDGIGLWDTMTGKLLKDGLGGAGQMLQSIAVSPDGKMLIAGGSKGAALFCDLGKGQCSPLNMQDGNPITNAAFSPTGKLFALGSLNSLRLWVPGASTFDKSVPSLRSSSVVFQPGAGTLLAAGGDAAQLVDVSSGKPAAKLADSDASYVRSVAFSPDGQLLAYGRDDGNIILRDVHSATHAELARVRAGKAVYALAFSSDGGTLASGDEGGNLQLWDLGRPAARAAGQLQVKAIGEPVRRNTFGLHSLSFSADASKIATAGMDWVAGAWDATPDGWLAQICQKAGRNLTNAEWQQYAAGVPYVKSCPNLPGPK